ncbi:MAG: acetylglutamate kinase [Phycisphaerales bacterium]|nr:acetylglutamate kinase [Phycisphaerales bacterium]
MRVRPLFVIKLGGALLDDAAALWATLDGVAAMHRANPGCVLVVHGGGSAVDRHLARLGIASEKRDGIRITPPSHMPEIAAVLNGTVNSTIVALLIARESSAVGLSLADGSTTRARVSTQFDFDPGCTGEITGGDPRLIETLLRAGFLPVVSSIAASAGGELLNVNGDDAAAALAKLVGATALVFLTDVAGVLDDDGTLIASLNGAEIERLIAQGVIHGGMIPKVRGAHTTARAIGAPVIITSWRDPTILTDLASGQSVGTAVHAVVSPNIMSSTR